jgi:hypothetical protein
MHFRLQRGPLLQPTLPAPNPFGYANRGFAATLYLMCDPALDVNGVSGCAIAKTVQQANGTLLSTARQCTGSIPVPVGTWDWSMACEAIKTLNPLDPTWIRGCGNNTVNPPLQGGTIFPKWSNALARGDLQCTPPVPNFN